MRIRITRQHDALRVGDVLTVDSKKVDPKKWWHRTNPEKLRTWYYVKTPAGTVLVSALDCEEVENER